jgi:ubiquinone/menaquinone biosynthesis C-methylase UbiE
MTKGGLAGRAAMEKAEFDQFADEYRAMHARNIRASGETPDYFAEYKVRDVSQYLASLGRTAHTVLDFGAGVGTSIPWFRRYFPQAAITCLDVSERSLEIGSSRFPGEARFVAFDGQRIPAPDGSFDLAFAACVFHHIDHAEHVSLMRELRRVLSPRGLLVIFEHNPLNPLTVAAVNTCPFDRNAKLIRPWALRQTLKDAGFRRPILRFRIFFPGALRALRPMEAGLRWCPAGAQYSVFAHGDEAS